MRLWIKMLLGLVFGVLTGVIFGEKAEIFNPIGTLFLNLISMVIIPLVLSSIVVGITNMHDPRKLGRVGLKTLGMYLMTTLAAITLGIVFGKIFFQPGAGLNLSLPLHLSTSNAPQLSDVVFALVPKNPITAFVEGNVLQVIVFALFLGIAINFSGERGRPLADFFESLSDVMSQLTCIIMELSPFGVFAIMAWVSGSFGLGVLLPMVKFMTVYYGACLVHMAVVFCATLWFMAKVNPWPFFKGMSDTVMVAFSTCSSSATLPVAMECVQKNLGVSKNVASFVMPLGSTINMNGAALFQGMSAIFIAQVYGIDLSWQSTLAIIVTATFSAIGAAGVPGSGFIMLAYVFGSAGLPLEGLAAFVGIDRIREMISTVLNVLGDAVCAVYIAKDEGELDERVYYQQELIGIEGDEI